MKIILVNHLHNTELFKIENNYLICDEKNWFKNGDLIEIINTKKDTYKKIVVSVKNGINKKILSLLGKFLFYPDKYYYDKVKI